MYYIFYYVIFFSIVLLYICWLKEKYGKTVKLIGIVGNAGHGKDTVADYLVNNYNFKKLSFATPLKQVCAIVFGLTDKEMNHEKETPMARWFGLTPRKIFQFVGTDLFRNKLQYLDVQIGRAHV